MQARNAAVATSVGLLQASKSEADVTQRCLVEDAEVEGPSEVSPLDGLRLRLEGEYARGCCKNVAIVHAGKGQHAAELRCAACEKHCGWLPKSAANWLLDILAFWPEAKTETQVLRNVKATHPRVLDFGNAHFRLAARTEWITDMRETEETRNE
jgi:hypothetical protein